MKKRQINPSPELNELERELGREKQKQKFRKAIRSTVYTLVVTAAVAVLVATVLLPVMRIYGNSMTPTLVEGDIVISVKGTKFETGDVVGVYYGSKILVKRIIAQAGEWVNIDARGNVYVNNQLIDEPYVSERALGECNIELPYQVPDNAVFVMGDHRRTSIDSRNTSVGCIETDDIAGKIIFRAWPFKKIGVIR
ncbi:MAG: signal peptidase I [Clostridia bacterium]|nr:signal peptidase I [Clostridia bacterium]